MKIKETVAALTLGAALLTSSTAQAKPSMMSSSKASLSASDKMFMIKAAQGGMAEVQLGHLATQKAASPAVKQFGQHMVTDHSKANKELMALATQKGVMLPTTVDPESKAVMAKLSKLSGTAFDKAYTSDMVDDHKKDIAEFTKEASKGHDPSVKSWAGKTLPTLKGHLQMITSIKSSGGKMSKMSGKM